MVRILCRTKCCSRRTRKAASPYCRNHDDNSNDNNSCDSNRFVFCNRFVVICLILLIPSYCRGEEGVADDKPLTFYWIKDSNNTSSESIIEPTTPIAQQHRPKSYTKEDDTNSSSISSHSKDTYRYHDDWDFERNQKSIRIYDANDTNNSPRPDSAGNIIGNQSDSRITIDTTTIRIMHHFRTVFGYYIDIVSDHTNDAQWRREHERNKNEKKIQKRKKKKVWTIAKYIESIGHISDLITSTIVSLVSFEQKHVIVQENYNSVSTSNSNKNIDTNHRKLEEYSSNEDEYEDDAYNAKEWGDNELCSKFIIKFLEGSTDARDTCEGIMNAYTAADCVSRKKASTNSDESSSYYYYYTSEHDYDDYFQDFTEHQCCQALQQHHADYCEEDTLLTNFHLFLATAVLLLCECAKAAVVHYQIHFLPEAGVCILVGTFVGTVLNIFTKFVLHESSINNKLSFDDDLFLSLLLPPIIFEAALSVSKFEFKRRRGAIFMFSVFGTVISTFTAGLMVHFVSKWSNATTFPMLDSLVFGALISSIDPVAILSVLTSLNLDQRDTIFILVFGESLLNDGIAITVFQTLVNRFDGKTKDNTTSLDEILDAVATFMISMIGSIVVGLACGCGAWAYFSLLGNLLPPVMEVGSFFLWALIPYYISDGVGWSGIVSIVAVGFFMDIYIAGPKGTQSDIDFTRSTSPSPRRPLDEYIDMNDERDDMQSSRHSNHSNMLHLRSVDSMRSTRSIGPLPSTERINMSATADRHVRFVAHITSHLAENAIFAYIGLFLFDNNYDWNPTLVAIAIFSCIVSRILMVIVVSWMIYHIYKCRGVSSHGHNSSRTAAAIQNPKTQAVLVLAGLRGAVSLALVENVPIYSEFTGEGCEFKQLMKGMTSACILFTTFVFGGGAYYILPHLGVTQDDAGSPPLSPILEDTKAVTSSASNPNHQTSKNNYDNTHPII